MVRARNAGNGGESVIGRNTRVRGRVTGEGDLRIEGHLEGDITLRGDLTIAEGGRATSAVDAEAVTVGGELDGDVRASGLVHLESGARVRGDIQGDGVAIDEGAELSGQLIADFELPTELTEMSSGDGRRR